MEETNSIDKIYEWELGISFLTEDEAIAERFKKALEKSTKTYFYRDEERNQAFQNTVNTYSKIFSQDIRVGFIAAARDLTEKINAGLIEDSKISITYQLIFNQKLDAFITLFLLIILWTVVVDMLRISFFKKN